MQRNNLPAVRQYLETFAINMYLKFPPLVRLSLVVLHCKNNLFHFHNNCEGEGGEYVCLVLLIKDFKDVYFHMQCDFLFLG